MYIHVHVHTYLQGVLLTGIILITFCGYLTKLKRELTSLAFKESPTDSHKVTKKLKVLCDGHVFLDAYDAL